MYYVFSALISWFIAQNMKVILESIIARKFLFKRYSGDGGYPSCHSALVTGYLVAVLIQYDWSNWLSTNTESKVVGGAIMFAIVVFKDAGGVRKEVGDIASVVNLITEILNTLEDIVCKFFCNLKKQGHLRHEIIAGIIIGTIVTFNYTYIMDHGKPNNILISIGLIFIIVIMFFGGIASRRNLEKAKKEENNTETNDFKEEKLDG